MQTSEQIGEIASALAKAQGALSPAIKDNINPAFRAKYADLAAVWEACRGPLASNGLTALQDVTTSELGVYVVTRILHMSGQWIEFGPLLIPVNKRDAQGVGSAISYGKRYALSAALGIVAEDDDDGNAAIKPRRDDVPQQGQRKQPTPASRTDTAQSPAGKAPTREQILAAIAQREEALQLTADESNAIYASEIGTTKTLSECTDNELRKFSLALLARLNAKKAAA